MKSNSMLMPAVWGGLFLGVFSALPFISAGNLCCCMWVIGGGMVAAYVLQSNAPQAITIGDGATVGLMAGIIGAVVQTVLALPVKFLMGGVAERTLQQIVGSNPDIPDNLKQLMETLGNSTAVSIIGMAIGFVLALIVGAIFAAIGGMLGAVFFKKQAAPVA